MELTKEEQALINAYRRGADISVYFHSCDSVDEAISCVNLFGDVMAINDFTSNGVGTNFVCFSNHEGCSELSVSANVDVRRRVEDGYND